MSQAGSRRSSPYPRVGPADRETLDYFPGNEFDRSAARNYGEPSETEAYEDANARQPNLDACFKLLASTQEQVRLADGKTAFLFGINALMFGFVASAVAPLKGHWQSNPLDPLTLIATGGLLCFVVLDAAAVMTLISMVSSRFRGLSSTSHIFFGHIVKSYGNNPQQYVEEVMRMDDWMWAQEICEQVVEVSQIALIKHRLARRAASFTLFAFICWLTAVTATLLLA